MNEERQVMKIDEQFNEILNNFAQINPSIVFKPGNVVSTLKPTKSVMARATVNSEFDKTFAVYSLNQFLQVISLFEDPEIDILDNHMSIRQGTERAKYIFCDPELIATPPDKAPILPSDDVVFSLTNDALTRIRKFANTILSPEIAVSGDGENIYMETLDTKNSSANTYRYKVGTTTSNFKLVFLSENLNILARDYAVTISSKGLAHFAAADVEYWIAVEANSTFGD